MYFLFDRYEILKTAFETLKNIETEQQNIDALETAMWKSCILANPENVQLDDGPYIFNKLKTELLSGLNNLKFSYTLSNIQEKNAAETLINKLIDLGKLDTALRISTIFNYKHKVSFIKSLLINILIDILTVLILIVGFTSSDVMFKFSRRRNFA